MGSPSRKGEPADQLRDGSRWRKIRVRLLLIHYIIHIMKKGTKVKTWTHTAIGTVVDYNPQTKEVTVKYKGSKAVDILPESMCKVITN